MPNNFDDVDLEGHPLDPSGIFFDDDEMDLYMDEECDAARDEPLDLLEEEAGDDY